MTKLTYLTPKRIQGEVGGTDGRLDVSARSSARSFYNSRDDGQTYSFVSEVTASNNTEHILYIKNTDNTGRALFIDRVDYGAEAPSTWHFLFVTGDAAGGSSGTPVNLNKISSNSAAATVRINGQITGLTADGLIHSSRHGAFEHNEEIFSDTIILGQNDAIAVLIASGSSGNAECSVRGYFETLE